MNIQKTLKVAVLAGLALVYDCDRTFGQKKKEISVIAYYAGPSAKVDSLDAKKLTHIIYSFSYLQGNRLSVKTKEDSMAILSMVALKKRNKDLKVMLSLGGWGGCETCSEIFSTEENRLAFAQSVLELNHFFKTDGIDLDWEFPALPSLPGHGYKKEDKHNFTLLVQALRKVLGAGTQISFAAGGFKWTLNESIEWADVMPEVNRVHLMSYDFMPGDASGHHTALFSTPAQKSSADYFASYLVQLGVPANKIVIGAAFYARVWDSIPAFNNGRYQKGKSAGAIAFKDIDTKLPSDSGFQRLWDTTASSPYIYNSRLQQFISYDNEKSVEAKTKYVIDHGFNGIMFWQLAQDRAANGLLNAIYISKKQGANKKPR